MNVASVKWKKKDTTNICEYIICRKGSKQGVKKTYLSGTERGRSKIVDAATKLSDKRVLESSEDSFVYHLHSCYSTYIKRSKRAGEKTSDGEEECEQSVDTVESVT